MVIAVGVSAAGNRVGEALGVAGAVRLPVRERCAAAGVASGVLVRCAIEVCAVEESVALAAAARGREGLVPRAGLVAALCVRGLRSAAASAADADGAEEASSAAATATV